MFIRVIHKSTLQSLVLLLGVCAAGAALLTWPQGVAGGISRGLAICSTVIIPSLFPFLVLAGFVTRTGISHKAGRVLTPVTRLLFGLPGCCAPAVIISLIGGYPAGGAAIGELVARGEITPAQGRRMLRFCVNGGPAFIVSAVGAGMLGHVRAGLLLFVAHVSASLLLGIGSRWHLRPQADAKASPPPPSAASATVPAAFVSAVNNACRSLMYMCGFVILFSALLSLADASGASEWCRWLASRPAEWLGLEDMGSATLLPALLEVSSGCVEAAGSGGLSPFLLGASMGWGGLSIHCQLAATLGGKCLITRDFFFFRLLHALLGGAFAMLLFHFVPLPIQAIGGGAKPLIQPFHTSAAAAVALLLMCALLLCISDREARE